MAGKGAGTRKEATMESRTRRTDRRSMVVMMCRERKDLPVWCVFVVSVIREELDRTIEIKNERGRIQSEPRSQDETE